ncbi:helix-turn-helix domain-containing protein [Mycolicibacterium gilvum]|uniref:helix-turn-helix domain-containing protein n=1 Tax=Mycolicibacterium gilvum TaxID=1804 RepID=UPI0013017CB8|nr:helix-turn-helix domain-containing protein [Mycolicibacterium gilvum]
MNTWETEQAARIGAEVQRLRKGLKRSAQWLSERTEELGLKMTRQAITDLENGRRRYVTTAELVILAVALDTAPVALVYPGPYRDRIDLVPGVERPKLVAAEWFSGNVDWRLEGSAGLSDEELEASNRSEENTHQLYLERQLFDLLRNARLVRERGEFEKDRELIEYYDKRIREIQKELGVEE